MKPTLWISNFASHRTPGMHGPVRLYTIMARPRRWEHGAGRVSAFVPPDPDELVRVIAARRQGLTDLVGAYREGVIRAWALNYEDYGHAPGELLAYCADGVEAPVLDGATLCCACSVDEARAGRWPPARAGPFPVRGGGRGGVGGVGGGPGRR